MNIDPFNEEYTEIENMTIDTSDEELKEMNKKFQEARNKGHVMATSIDNAQLRKLQDDLRKAGYRKVQ